MINLHKERTKMARRNRQNVFRDTLVSGGFQAARTGWDYMQYSANQEYNNTVVQAQGTMQNIIDEIQASDDYSNYTDTFNERQRDEIYSITENMKNPLAKQRMQQAWTQMIIQAQSKVKQMQISASRAAGIRDYANNLKTIMSQLAASKTAPEYKLEDGRRMLIDQRDFQIQQNPEARMAINEIFEKNLAAFEAGLLQNKVENVFKAQGEAAAREYIRTQTTFNADEQMRDSLDGMVNTLQANRQKQYEAYIKQARENESQRVTELIMTDELLDVRQYFQLKDNNWNHLAAEDDLRYTKLIEARKADLEGNTPKAVEKVKSNLFHALTDPNVSSQDFHSMLDNAYSNGDINYETRKKILEEAEENPIYGKDFPWPNYGRKLIEQIAEERELPEIDADRIVNQYNDWLTAISTGGVVNPQQITQKDVETWIQNAMDPKKISPIERALDTHRGLLWESQQTPEEDAKTLSRAEQFLIDIQLGEYTGNLDMAAIKNTVGNGGLMYLDEAGIENALLQGREKDDLTEAEVRNLQINVEYLKWIKLLKKRVAGIFNTEPEYIRTRMHNYTGFPAFEYGGYIYGAVIENNNEVFKQWNDETKQWETITIRKFGL